MSDLPPELLTPDERAEAKADDAERKEVKTRIPSGSKARENHELLKREDKKRSHRRALTKAMIDGARPFPEDNSGQCSLNLLDGKAIMAQSAVPYYALFNDVGCYVEVQTNHEPQNPENERWGQTIAKRFHEMLWRWEGFDWQMQQASYWMRLHGPGPVYRDKINDWRFRSLESGMVLVPAGSASCVDERLPLVEIIVPYRVHELFGFHQKAADGTGWNKEVLRRTIRHHCRDQEWAKSANGVAEWEVFERQFNSNDLNPSLSGGFINCVHLLFKEWDGKISKVIFTEEAVDTDARSAGDTGKDHGFLFQSIGCYKRYTEALVVFFKDIGDGTWHSVRGYASDAFDSLVTMNQLYCAQIDAARVESTIILEFQTTAQRDKMDKFQVRRGITKLPVGAKIQQARLQGSMQGTMAISQMISTKLHNNLGNLQGRGMSREDGKGETVTAAEVRARVAKESSLDQGDVTLFYGHLDHVYSMMFEPACDPDTTDEEAKRFQLECIEDGVPKEALTKCEIWANRESGYGSPAMRELKLQQLTELAPSLPTEGQANLIDMKISAIAGPDKVPLLNPRQHVPDLNDAMAAMENAMIAQGRQPVMISGQDDVIHLHSHLADATDYLEPINQAMDAGQNDAAALEEAFRYTELMAAHCEEHLGRLFADPTRREAAEMFKDELAHIVSFSGKLRGAVINAQKEAELAAEQAQQATALGALDAAKVQSVQTHTQLASAKTLSKIQNDQAKLVNKIKLDQIQAAARIQAERQRAVVMPKEKAA